jgi:hypothetical protein
MLEGHNSLLERADEEKKWRGNYCETCSEGGNLKRHFRSSTTSTSTSTSYSMPSTIHFCICLTFFGGSCMTGYVLKLSYDQDRAVEILVLQVGKRKK